MLTTPRKCRVYPRAVSRDRVRALLIVLFAAAAALSLAGNESGAHWLNALAFCCFAAGVYVILRWRRRIHATVLDREDKTPSDREEQARE